MWGLVFLSGRKCNLSITRSGISATCRGALVVYPGVHFGGAGDGCGSCSLILEILPSSKRSAICPAPALSV